MFFLDEEQEQLEQSIPSRKGDAFSRAAFNSSTLGGRFRDAARNDSFEDDDRMFANGYSGHESLGCFKVDNCSSDENEEPSELVPMSYCTKRRNRQRSSTKTGFFDFYRMTEENLGSGAYASVRTCASIATGKEYAVKIVDKAVPTHTRSRIQREVDTFNICRNHPNIVQLIEWFEDDKNFYMVFEKMAGGMLLHHIQRKKCFTEHEAAQVTHDIATALKFLHDHGIAHRDVKPENILCTEKDRVSPVKLCDLDLASKVHTSQKMPAVSSEPDLASPVGSAEFMAPEVVDAFVGESLKYDKKCDMWSLGVIIYIMLCGYPPFCGSCTASDCGWDLGEQCDECQSDLFERIQKGIFDFPDEEWESISAAAKDLIRHLLVRNAKKRYTADDVLRHPWVAGGAAPKTELLTPDNLLTRNNSTRNVHEMTENFNVMNRMISVKHSSCHEDNSSESSSAPQSLEEPSLFASPYLLEGLRIEAASPVSFSWAKQAELDCLRYPMFSVDAPTIPESHDFSRNYYNYDAPPQNLRVNQLNRNTPPNASSCQSDIARQESVTELYDQRREQHVDA